MYEFKNGNDDMCCIMFQEPGAFSESRVKDNAWRETQLHVVVAAQPCDWACSAVIGQF